MFLPMYFKNPTRMSIHQPNNSALFAYPIHGLEIGGTYNLEFGPVTFVSADSFHAGFDQFSNVKTFAIVDFRDATNLQQNPTAGLNSLALQLIKQCIGAIHVEVFNNLGERREKKIAISHYNHHELDEGIIPYLSFSEYGNKFVLNNNTGNDLTLNISEMGTFSLDNWRQLLSIPLQSRNEVQNKICKCLEMLYYIYNEVYASERLIKFFIILNHVFKPSGSNINRNFIIKQLNTIFNIISPTKVFENNFNTNMNQLYEQLRNNIMHGIIDFYSEVSLVDVNDYLAIKNIVMNLIIVLISNEDIKNIANTIDLNKYIKDAHKDYIKQNKAR